MLWGQRFQGLLLLALVLKIATTDALYQKGGPVQLLSHKTFDATVLQSDLPAVVEFFAPWYCHVRCALQIAFCNASACCCIPYLDTSTAQVWPLQGPGSCL